MNGSPTCTVGPLLVALVVELRRGEQARAVDAVAPGARADVDDRVADARRRARGRCGRAGAMPRVKALTRMFWS